MLKPELLQFLYELSQNNHRDWFEKNKKRYEETVKKPFEEFIGQLMGAMREYEPNFKVGPKECIHRIYRDTRFSANKTPYKTHVSAILTPNGRKSMHLPGYYFHLEFGNLMLGGGAYSLEKEPLAKIRTAIAQDPEGFHALIEAPDFVSNFGELKGDKNKVLQAPFKEMAQKEPLIFNKQFYFVTETDPEISLKPDFTQYVAEQFRAAKDLNHFLRAALV